MREYKYRVYSFLSKYFIYFDIYEYAPDGVAGGVSEPQQLIGLTDKNNNPIYEGDIVEWKEESIIAEVYWSHEDVAFIIKSNNGGSAFMNQTYMLNFEVIGNIFENSELLKK